MKDRRYIKNELAYFKKVVRNMDLKDRIKQSHVGDHEIFLDEILYDNLSENHDPDSKLTGQGLLGWIESMENQELYDAVKKLSAEDQIFISYIFKECKTQRELAKIYNVSQSKISVKINKLFKNLKNKLLQK